MRRVIAGIALLGLGVVLLPGIALARPGYMAEFTKTYSVKPGSALDGAKCNLCHVANAPKVQRNPYGMSLEKALGKPDVKDTKEIGTAIKKIENELSPDKKTKYIERIKADKLPGA